MKDGDGFDDDLLFWFGIKVALGLTALIALFIGAVAGVLYVLF